MYELPTTRPSDSTSEQDRVHPRSVNTWAFAVTFLTRKLVAREGLLLGVRSLCTLQRAEFLERKRTVTIPGLSRFQFGNSYQAGGVRQIPKWGMAGSQLPCSEGARANALLGSSESGHSSHLLMSPGQKGWVRHASPWSREPRPRSGADSVPS